MKLISIKNLPISRFTSYSKLELKLPVIDCCAWLDVSGEPFCLRSFFFAFPNNSENIQ